MRKCIFLRLESGVLWTTDIGLDLAQNSDDVVLGVFLLAQVLDELVGSLIESIFVA